MKSLQKKNQEKTLEKSVFKAGTRSYEEIIKIITSIKKELERGESAVSINDNVRIL